MPKKTMKAKISKGQFWLLKQMFERYNHGKQTIGQPLGIYPGNLSTPYPGSADYAHVNMQQLKGLLKRGFCSESNSIYTLTETGVQAYFYHIDPYIVWG
jgi:hypothetical protein